LPDGIIERNTIQSGRETRLVDVAATPGGLPEWVLQPGPMESR